MGSRSIRFNFTPGENEQIETVIKVPEEKRSMIHGVVKDCHNKVVKDAIVKLYEVLSPHDEHALKPLTHSFTDECGQFAFGPLLSCKHYAIKVWINDVKIRELVIRPEEDCSYHKKFYKKPSKPCDKHEIYDNDYKDHGKYSELCYDDDDLDD